MIITILNVEETNKKTTGGKSYQQLEIAFKDDNGKVGAKKIMSFTFPECYNVLKSAKSSEVFEILSEKNEKSGYWDWIKATPEHIPVDKDSKKPSNYVDPRETKEEREKRQIMIVRQSCLAQAVTFNAGASIKEVLETAEQFEAWVMREVKETVVTMEDDIPF